MQEVKWPSFNEERNTDVFQKDYFPFLQFIVLFPEDGTAILNLILLCDFPENLYEFLLSFSAQGIVCFENNLLNNNLDVLKFTVSQPLQFSYSALKS